MASPVGSRCRAVDNRGRGVNDWGGCGDRDNNWFGDISWDWNRGWCIGWNWGWSIGWGWSVGWNWGLVGGLLREHSLTLVLDISDVASFISVVGHNLDTTVGKVDAVFASGVVVVTVFSMGEDWAVVVVIYTIVESVVGRHNGIHNWDWSISWGWGSIELGHAGSASQESSRESNLKSTNSVRIWMFSFLSLFGNFC